MLSTEHWELIKYVESGMIIAIYDWDNSDRIRVSFPEDLSEDDVRDALAEADKDIQVGDLLLIESGEEDGETVAFFSKP